MWFEKTIKYYPSSDVVFDEPSILDLVFYYVDINNLASTQDVYEKLEFLHYV